jgi:spermidine/putrescine-binding protein
MKTLAISLVSLVFLANASGAPLLSEAKAFQRVNNGLAADSIEAGDTVNLNIVNSDDYIGPDVIQEFEDYCKATDGVNVNVIYSTFSTPEEILAKITTGSATYDLVNDSDYIIQKMMTLNLLRPFATGAERTALYGSRNAGWDDNYAKYASPYLQDKLNSISADVDGVPEPLGTYARGYMWGTLGLTYNPYFSAYQGIEKTADGKNDPDASANDVKVQMCDWNSLWSDNYRSTFQIKDSMRDTYSIGLMHVYDSDFKAILSWYESGKDNEGVAYSAADYNRDMTIIYNNINNIPEFNALAKKIDSSTPDTTPENIVDSIQEALVVLKDNSFGLEVDSGKTDITTNDESGIDTAWSGDAITSMNLGDTESFDLKGDGSKEPLPLYYSIPATGGNIWFDNWVMLDSPSLNQEYAQKFVDFISDPNDITIDGETHNIAVENMSYIGYTSFVAGDSLIDYVRDSYDPRTSAMYVYDDANDDWLYDDNGDKVYQDGSGIHDDGLDYGDTDMTGSTYEFPVLDGVASLDWSDYADANGWTPVDLSYFFDGSLTDYADNVDTKFYSSEIEKVTGKNLDGVDETVYVGRQFLAQYPTEDALFKGTVLDQIPSLAIMEDYGTDNNTYVLRMWENVKSSGGLAAWVIAVLGVEAGLAIGFGLYFFSKKRTAKLLRKRRREPDLKK